jgi:multidrug efflux pump subunit AcrB
MIHFALRRPITILVAVIAIGLLTWLAVKRMGVDIFPSLNLPVVYVCQPYGGMDPAQMEGLITNYYEYHFLYISGIHHVESRNVQGMALMKLYFHPGTNMSQAMAETISYVNRARAFMPPGTVNPFVTRFDTGSVPVGYLVLSSESRTLADIQDIALFNVRNAFADLPGVSAPPPFGGSARSALIRLNMDTLQSQRLTPDEVITALTQGNLVTPSGNLKIGDQYPIIPTNAMVKNISELGNIAIRTGTGKSLFLRDVAEIVDGADITTGYALVNGKRAIYILVTKRAEAATLNVINNIKEAIPRIQKGLPDDIRVSFELDQSPTVLNSVRGLVTEGLLGAALTGLMVLLFLRDWRSVIVVVINIPLALACALIGLWLGGQTVNLMTLGGLALAVGILVDEATVEVENIHTQLAKGMPVARAVLVGNSLTVTPRLLAMLCILAVFLPALFLEGAAQGLFYPMALSVGLAMIASYLLSNTVVPVLAVWLFQSVPHAEQQESWLQRSYSQLATGLIHSRWVIVPAYLVTCASVLWWQAPQLGTDIFPRTESGKFRMRLRAPDGTAIQKTEEYAKQTLAIVNELVGTEKIHITLGYVGSIPASYPVNAVYQWSRGPEEAILMVGLKPGSGVSIARLQEQLRERLAKDLPELRASFEPADIVNEVMSFGSPTPIEIAVYGSDLKTNREYAEKIRLQLLKVGNLRDIQYMQSLDYPVLEVQIDRQRAAWSDVRPQEITRSLLTATSSSRFVVPNYWPDPKSGVGYQVQVEIPQGAIKQASELADLPIKSNGDSTLLLGDVANIQPGVMPGQYDRYNMKRTINLTANLGAVDLGQAIREVELAMIAAGPAPEKVETRIRGQVPTFYELQRGLTFGLILAIVVVFLLLAAYFQSLVLALATITAVPAALLGVTLMLRFTGDSLNLQSFQGAIMSIGVAMANAILLLTFCELQRRDGATPFQAAQTGAAGRLRPILMTTAAMIAGMFPLAFGWGEASAQAAPLGRAVIGGLSAATLATLFILPAVYALLTTYSRQRSASLHPADPDSRHFDSATSLTGSN